MRYPHSERGPVVETLHGVKVADPYRWLEDPDSAQTKEWVAAQNAITEEYLAGLASRGWFHKQLSAILGVPVAGVPRARGGQQRTVYLLDRNDGSQDQDVVMVADDLATLAAGGRVLIDPAEFSADGTTSLRAAILSPDGKWVAYKVSEAGSDWTKLRVRSVGSGADTADVVSYAKFVHPEWLPDSSGFFYWTYPEHGRASGDNPTALGTGQLMLHRLGRDDDELIYQPDNPRLLGWPFVFADGWLILTITVGAGRKCLVQARRLDGGTVGPVVHVVTEALASIDPVGVKDDVLYLHTDSGAPRGKVVSVDLASVESGGTGIWAELIPERDDILERAARAGGGFLAVYLRDAQHHVVRFDAAGAELGEVDLADAGQHGVSQHGVSQHSAGSVTEMNVDGDSSECFLGVESFVRGTRAYRVDLSTGRADPLVLEDQAAPVPDVVTERRSATSADGTTVPYFLLRPAGASAAGAEAALPTLLYGYGGYNKAMTPAFKAAWPAWLAAGGAVAVANLRGGGEYGREWHEAGRREHKQNVFDDFIAVGEHLISTGVTTHGQLVLHGRSNGGLLVGAVMTQRPDLAGVALPMVGVMDKLRFHKFTIGAAWIAEAGDPDVASDFAFLYAFSPLHALRAGTSYPATLILTGDHDDRVAPAHSYKFGAELQHDQAGDAPVLLRIEAATGHGLGKPKRMLAAEFADMLAFAAEHTGLTPT
jgi:prolyl oligopeptidase